MLVVSVLLKGISTFVSEGKQTELMKYILLFWVESTCGCGLLFAHFLQHFGQKGIDIRIPNITRTKTAAEIKNSISTYVL